MKHHTAVFKRIRWGILHPLIGKSVVEREVKRGKWLVKKEMAKAVIKGIVVVVVHLDHVIHYPKRVSVVVTYFMMMKLGGPSVKIFAVKQLTPFLSFSRGTVGIATA